MSNKQQTEKNLALVEKLIHYLNKSSTLSVKRPENASYVIFSADDEELNELNERLLQSLIKEKKPVIKAVEPKTKTGKWQLIPL